MEAINYDAYVLSKEERRKYYVVNVSVLAGLGYIFYHDIVFALILAMILGKIIKNI